jgi:hypothetical protein
VPIDQKLPGDRFPLEIIGHAVWLYHRYALSDRGVEELECRCAAGGLNFQGACCWCAWIIAQPQQLAKTLNGIVRTSTDSERAKGAR